MIHSEIVPCFHSSIDFTRIYHRRPGSICKPVGTMTTKERDIAFADSLTTSGCRSTFVTSSCRLVFIAVLVSGLVGFDCVSSALPHATVELPTDVNIFADPISDPNAHAQKRYFRYLTVDPVNDGYIYVGGIDHVYRLDTSDISKNFLKSVNLSQVFGISEAIRDNLHNCVTRGKDLGFSCQNHVRAVIRHKSELFVCATGVDSPIVYYLSISNLAVESVELRGGRAKCPYDPSSNYTILYVESGNPGDIPSIYSGTVTDLSNADSVIFRPPLIRDRQTAISEYRLLRTDQDSRWLNDPQFVGSFSIDDYVYFFFREHAIEQAGCGKVVFSRVARVCKNDEGGSSLSMDYRWTTFVKARLNCSQPGDSPFYFNEIYDVYYNTTDRVFYGLFRTIHNGYWGAAVCSFSLTAIDQIFDTGPFKGQQNFETSWFAVPDREVPSPRPGQCRHSSLELSTSALSFIKSHPLMHDSVDTIDSRPNYFTKDDLAATRLVVDYVGKYTIFFIGSSRGTIHKIAQWRDSSGRVQYLTVAILKPFRNVVRPIWQMLLLRVTSLRTTYLYLGTDDAVIQLPVEECYRYSKCLHCVRDPYCGWDGTQHTCRPYRSGAGLIQRVSLTAAEDACNQLCVQAGSRHHIVRSEVLQGVPVHLTCNAPVAAGCLSHVATSGGEPSRSITWHFVEAGSSSGHVIKPDGVELILTHDYGLVIMDVRGRHNGTYTCSTGGVTIARHELRVLPCRLQMDRLEDTWKDELVKWCSAVKAYQEEYNHWLCLKNQCLKEKCIPQKIIDKCQL